MDDARALEAITTELDALLAKVAPDEAPFARDYVARPFSVETRTENPFGFPGGGAELLYGPWALRGALATAVRVASAAAREGPVAAVAGAAVSWLTRRTPPAAVLVSPADTRARIVAELVRAGWEEPVARLACEEILQTGERISTRVAALAAGASSNIPGDAIFPMTRLASLRDVLADLYHTAAGAQIVASDIGADLKRIVFAGTAQSIWHSLLDEIRHHGLIGAVVRRAQKDYPEYPPLQQEAIRLGIQ